MSSFELTEHQIQSQCIQYLGMRGYYVQRLNAGKYALGEGRFRRFVQGVASGTPDLMAFKKRCQNCQDDSEHDVHLLFVEVKRPKKKPTPLQEAKMQELTQYGARCIVVHSVEELQAQL